MTFNNITMKARTIVNSQYTVHAAYYTANDAANDRSQWTRIVLTNTSAMIGAVWYALSVRPGR